MIRLILLTVLTALPSLTAQVTTYTSESAFLTATRARSIGGFPNLGLVASNSFTQGPLTFSQPFSQTSGAALYIGTGSAQSWTDQLAGNELAMSAVENLDVEFSNPATAYGFRFFQPTAASCGSFPRCCGLTPCQASTFDVTVESRGVIVATLAFTPPENRATFFGIASTVAFDAVRFRERVPNDDNEYWGEQFVVVAGGLVGGCPGSGAPWIAGTPSSSNVFSIGCSTFEQSCSGAPVLLFGECAPLTISVPPPIGCGPCTLAVSPVWGSTSVPFIIGAGLPTGGSFCVQCGCIAGGCVDLSTGLVISIGP